LCRSFVEWDGGVERLHLRAPRFSGYRIRIIHTLSLIPSLSISNNEANAFALGR